MINCRSKWVQDSTIFGIHFVISKGISRAGQGDFDFAFKTKTSFCDIALFCLDLQLSFFIFSRFEAALKIYFTFFLVLFVEYGYANHVIVCFTCMYQILLCSHNLHHQVGINLICFGHLMQRNFINLFLEHRWYWVFFKFWCGLSQPWWVLPKSF